MLRRLGNLALRSGSKLPVTKAAASRRTPKSLTIALMGDIMLGRGVNPVIAAQGPRHPWGDLLPLLRAADLRIANLECAITSHQRPWRRTPKVFHFRADPEAVEALKVGGIDCVSLANNHILDFEEEGLLETIELLDRAGIAHAGAGRNLEEAARPALLRAGEVTVGVIAFTDNEPAFAAGPDRPGTNYLEISPDPETLARVERAVSAARSAGADLVVLSIHWGPNMQIAPPPHFRCFAQAVVKTGVDLLHGHSAHLFQGVEFHRGRPILCDTGDFIDDYAVDPDLRNDWSFLFLAAFRPGAKPSWGLEMVPVRLPYCRVELAEGQQREQIIETMLRRSEMVGTTLRREGERLAAP